MIKKTEALAMIHSELIALIATRGNVLAECDFDCNPNQTLRQIDLRIEFLLMSKRYVVQSIKK